MGQAEGVGRVGQRLEDARVRVTRELPERLIEAGDVPLRRLPGLDSAGVHDLDRVAASGAEQPRRVVPRPVALAAHR